MVEHVYQDGVFGSWLTKSVRDTFDGTTFRRQIYIKTKKRWKTVMQLTAQEWLAISEIKQRPRPLYRSYYIMKDKTDEKNFGGYDFESEPIREFFKHMSKEVPAFNYWRKKLESLQFHSLIALSILLEYRDIPETESLIMSKCDRYNTGATYYKMTGLVGLCKDWRKITKAERKLYINNMRTFCDGRYNSLLSNVIITISPSWGGVRGWLKKFYPEQHPNEIVLQDYTRRDKGLNVFVKDVMWLMKHANTTVVQELISLMHEFSDYLREVYDEATDIFDPYWRYRRNWQEIHREQVARRNAERERRKILGEALRKDELTEKYKPYKDMVLEEGDLRAYTSNDIEEWRKHAKALRQCIISCEYDRKKGSILIFVTRNGKPEATAEIGKDNKIKQFYADESSKETEHPKDDVRELMDHYLAKYKIM